ncbi:c-type cytochrome [Roseovarius pelagicus]|uniref:C-type cytochrome n=1 Tax=Roseovarius pelagicus TaxID=2980108 RepID=A0ABY6DDM3_9RHOB|nr:c-type cytochrome [Roseovarius pelagicus]UXX84241.1 c-type cytochrome [Roseovarius pelagicus]
MSKYLKPATLMAFGCMIAVPALAGNFGLGRPALPAEIEAWDLDIHPDGTGLPAGSGDVATGEAIFAAKCASCHGDFAEGVGNWPKLAGGDGTLADEDPVKTVGSYWPYLSTTWDYINRSMPFGDAQSLEIDEVYAITAYILYSNYLVDDDFVLSNETFSDVDMPNADGFIVDDRAETEYPKWIGEPCMQDCKDAVEITMRARVLDVTPETEGDAESTVEPTEATTEPTVEEAVGPDPQLVAKGEKVFRKCQACHKVGDKAKNGIGPHLNGIIGRAAGSVDGFRYSKPLTARAEEGLVWTPEELSAFLASPKSYLKGTKMAFNGLRKEADLEAITAYLSTFTE